MRTRATPVLVALLIMLAFAGGYFFRDRQAPRSGSRPSNGKSPPAPTASAKSVGRDGVLQRGRAWAQTYCSGCHLFPDPQLLTKTDWAHHIMPEMALWLGMEPVNYESLPDGKILQEANLFPPSPMMSEEDWFAIWEFYKSAAPSRPLPQLAKPQLQSGLKRFRVKKVNFHGGAPMTSLVKIDSLHKRLYVGDAFAGLLATLDPAGAVLNTLRLGNAPVGLTTKESGLYLTLIGSIFPSDATKGALVFVPNDQSQPQPLLENLRRPTDTIVADLNQDGREDLVVCSFGNRLGRFSWFENKGGAQYEEHVLLDRPGAIRSELYDFDGDGRLDIIVLMAQAREGIYIFFNQGRGQFRMETVVEQHPLFGYASFQLVDFNKDGHIDIITANGDNGDNPSPHKNYHGVRIYLNDGQNHFKEAWFYAMEGAYKAVAADFDEDGDLDIAAISFYPDYDRPQAENFVYLENKGNFQFDAHTFPESAIGRWMVMDVGDLDGDGDIDIVLGSFALGPTTIPVPQSVRENWKTNGAAVLILENVLR